jgi:hypothetical protein
MAEEAYIDSDNMPVDIRSKEFMSKNLINLIDNMEPINIISKEKFEEISSKYRGLNLFSRRYEDPDDWLGRPADADDSLLEVFQSTAWDRHITEFYTKYVRKSEEINEYVSVSRQIPMAISQFKSLVYAGRLNDIFTKRIASFGEVGPRGMSKSFSVLNKKLKNKKLPFKKLIKNWERNLIEQISGEASLARDSLLDMGYGVPDLPEKIRDQSLSFYTSARSGLSQIRDPALVISVLIANKFQIHNHQQFEHILKIANIEYTKVLNRNFGYDELNRFFKFIFTDMNGLNGKIAKIFKISSFAHNRGHGLSTGYFVRMMNDPNFKDFGRNTTVNKYFDMCTKLTRLGGLAAIRRQYQPMINSLIASKMLARGFYKRVREAYRICREGLRIRPNLEGLQGDSLEEQLNLRRLMETVDTELTAVRDYAAYEEYNELVIVKDKKLFNLNWEVKSKNFRFRVLKTYDPTHFKVGVSTQCCQRLGGLGEGAAIDSYVNPLAGVVLLELYVSGFWELAAQSYFHYVPHDNGYILDNVETNRSHISKTREITGYSKETLYAMLAQRVKENFDVEYFLSGKGYSEITVSSYGSKRLPYDPRDFAWRKKYTDWKASSSIDLLSPNFDVPDLPKGKGDRVKKISQFRDQVFGLKKVFYA